MINDIKQFYVVRTQKIRSITYAKVISRGETVKEVKRGGQLRKTYDVTTIGNTVKLIEAEKLLAKHFHFSFWCRCCVWWQESPYMSGYRLWRKGL